jgi:hypothetical protein
LKFLPKFLIVQLVSTKASHRRSLFETAMFRLKMIFGGRLRRRGFDSLANELFLQYAALNRMIGLGKPDSYKVED